MNNPADAGHPWSEIARAMYAAISAKCGGDAFLIPYDELFPQHRAALEAGARHVAECIVVPMYRPLPDPAKWVQWNPPA